MLKTKSGFTIVELLIVIVVIGILAVITVVAYNGIQARSYNTTIQSNLVGIAKKLALFNVDNDRYPGSAAELESLALKVNRSSYAIHPDTAYNLFYCTAAGNTQYAILTNSKSGARLYITNSDSGEYTGSVPWNQSTTEVTAATVCRSILANSTMVTYGYRKTTGGWEAWAGE